MVLKCIEKVLRQLFILPVKSYASYIKCNYIFGTVQPETPWETLVWVSMTHSITIFLELSFMNIKSSSNNMEKKHTHKSINRLQMNVNHSNIHVLLLPNASSSNSNAGWLDYYHYCFAFASRLQYYINWWSIRHL